MNAQQFPRPSEAQAEPARLLIVEPHRSALQLMAKRLGHLGYRVIGCDNAASARAEMVRAPVGLVLAELRMAPISGIDLTARIRGDSLLRDTPVVLIAGRSDRTGAIDGLAAGADDVVAKPFHFEVLAARIARQLARASALKLLRVDNAALDARVVTRSIELDEIRAALRESEAERTRLQRMIAAR